jgi:hypothetical protein
MIETAWLLDDGRMCVGVNSRGGFGMVPYTSVSALHFSRDVDAHSLRFALCVLGHYTMSERVKAVEHQWG